MIFMKLNHKIFVWTGILFFLQVIEKVKEGETLEKLWERTASDSMVGEEVGGAARKK